MQCTQGMPGATQRWRRRSFPAVASTSTIRRVARQHAVTPRGIRDASPFSSTPSAVLRHGAAEPGHSANLVDVFPWAALRCIPVTIRPHSPGVLRCAAGCAQRPSPRACRSSRLMRRVMAATSSSCSHCTPSRLRCDARLAAYTLAAARRAMPSPDGPHPGGRR